MLIFIVARAYPDTGAPQYGIFEWDQARALRRAGHTVVYLAVDLRSLRRARKLGVRRFTEDGVHAFTCSVPVGRVWPMAQAKLGVNALKNLYQIAEKALGKPDVMHAHFPVVSYMAACVASKHSVPLIISEHLSAMLKTTPDPRQAVAQKAYPWAFERIAVSPALKMALETRFHTGAQYIPNLIDSTVFYPPAQAKEMKPFRFISVGNFVKDKCHEMTIQAVGRLRTEGLDVRLLIAGRGERLDACRALVRDLNLETCIELPGYLNRAEIADRLRAAHAYVLPSRVETFGVAYIEAMACGLPVIATRCGGPESFVSASNGLLTAVDDLDGLTDAMRRVAKGECVFDGACIARETEERFSSERVVQALEMLYRRAARPRALILFSAMAEYETLGARVLSEAARRAGQCDLVVAVPGHHDGCLSPREIASDERSVVLLTLTDAELVPRCAAQTPKHIFLASKSCRSYGERIARACGFRKNSVMSIID